MENIKDVRVIGNAPEEEKNRAIEKMQKALSDSLSLFSEKKREKITTLEYQKTEQEMEVLDITNEILKEIMEKSGAKSYDISPENFHIVPPELYKEIDKKPSHAGSMMAKQSVFFNATSVKDNPFFFGTLCVHEGTHLRGHLTLEMSELSNDPDNFNISRFREGWSVNASLKKIKEDKGHHHFEGVHEGIASLVQKNSIPLLLELPMFTEEKKWRESDEGKSIWTERAKEYGVPEEEIIWINPKNANDCRGLGYQEQRETLEYVFSELQKEFPEKYETDEDVYKEFLKAHFTGRLLPIARDVEKTFGEEGFRILGNMETDKNSGILTLETLKKRRMRMLKKSEKDG
jgi:hypothetical protein